MTVASYGKMIPSRMIGNTMRSEEHTSELQSLRHLVCRLLLEKKKKANKKKEKTEEKTQDKPPDNSGPERTHTTQIASLLTNTTQANKHRRRRTHDKHHQRKIE